MELLLNILWLGVSLALITMVARERNTGSRIRVLVAAALVVVCLFPAISISDDLHVDAMAVDEPGWRSFRCPIQAQHSTAVLLLAAAVPSAVALAKEFKGFVSLATAPSARAGFKSSSSLRAPPSFLLS